MTLLLSCLIALLEHWFPINSGLGPLDELRHAPFSIFPAGLLLLACSYAIAALLRWPPLTAPRRALGFGALCGLTLSDAALVRLGAPIWRIENGDIFFMTCVALLVIVARYWLADPAAPSRP